MMAPWKRRIRGIQWVCLDNITASKRSMKRQGELGGIWDGRRNLSVLAFSICRYLRMMGRDVRCGYYTVRRLGTVCFFISSSFISLSYINIHDVHL